MFSDRLVPLAYIARRLRLSAADIDAAVTWGELPAAAGRGADGKALWRLSELEPHIAAALARRERGR